VEAACFSEKLLGTMPVAFMKRDPAFVEVIPSLPFSIRFVKRGLIRFRVERAMKSFAEETRNDFD